MDNGTAIAIIVAIAAILVATWLYLDRRKTRRLRSKFGPEYDRTVQTQPSARQAERVLQSREKRVAKFNIRPLSRDEMERFTERWRKIQERFVDDPSGAVQMADQLINEALSARGYPMSDFEQQAADLSVDYPIVVDHYRAGHAPVCRRCIQNDLDFRLVLGQAINE